MCLPERVFINQEAEKYALWTLYNMGFHQRDSTNTQALILPVICGQRGGPFPVYSLRGAALHQPLHVCMGATPFSVSDPSGNLGQCLR
jgi:hypothetical protein